MKNNKFSKIKVFNGLKGFVLGFVLAASLVAGAVYAWNAVWHGTDWIESGAVIDGQKIAENLEYLKQEITNLQTQINNVQGSGGGTVVAGCGRRTYWGINGTATCWGGASWPSGSYANNNGCPTGSVKIQMGVMTENTKGAWYYYQPAFVCVKDDVQFDNL